MYAERLRRLLAPLGVYTLEGGVSGAELEALGRAMDGVRAQFDALLRESAAETAESFGLENWESLLPFRPAAGTAAERRAALSGLLGMDWLSFTGEAVNRALRGCGTEALAEETETPRTLRLTFPAIKGVPKDIAQLQAAIEQILPCHLAVEYVYRYNDWNFVLSRILTWDDLGGRSWAELETM